MSNSKFNSQPEFKILIVGDASVVKSTFLKKHLTGVFDSKYTSITTMIKVLAELKCCQWHSTLRWEMWRWRCGTQLDKRSWLDWEMVTSSIWNWFSIGADAAIVMFDFGSKTSYKSTAKWFKDVTRVCGNIPITLVGNKFDIEGKKIRPSQVNFHSKKGISFFCVSTKDDYQTEQPFLELLRKLQK